MKEIIKPLSGFEDKYQVSNMGYVQHIDSGRIVGTVNRDGYLRTTINNSDGPHFVMIHRLVALTFLPYRDGYTVNHIDGNKLNNRVDNLEFISQAENNRHRSRARGFKSKPHKSLTVDQVKTIRKSKLNNQQLGNMFGVSRYIIRDCRLGRTYANV